MKELTATLPWWLLNILTDLLACRLVKQPLQQNIAGVFIKAIAV